MKTSNDQSNEMPRRRLIERFGIGATAAGLLAPLAAGGAAFFGRARDADAASITDADILNFALNLEYLEAEFYLRAVFGKGIPPDQTDGTGKRGSVTGGSQVPFLDPNVQQYAEEIALDELAHVKLLRGALGSKAVARPMIDLDQSFTTAARLAGLIGPTGTFSPFTDDTSFLLGAYIFEDVGVTAYHGAAPLIRNKAFLSAAAGLLGVEAYHASQVRTDLFVRGLGTETAKISKLRAAASGANDDQGVTKDGKANIVPTDSNGLVFSRTPQQVLNIVYLGGASSNNGFFPDMLNGIIH